MTTERVGAMDSQDYNLSYFLNGNSTEDPGVKLALEDIAKSGLSPETLQKAGVKLFNGTSDCLKERLGFASLQGESILSVATLMEIPYHDAQCEIVKYEYRLYPQMDGRKYLHPLKSSPVPYVPADVWDIKEKANKPLWITEGVKKALKIGLHGEHCISLPGVWGFRAAEDEASVSNLCPVLDSFTWSGRTVYLAFDIDLWTNPGVRKAVYELGFRLTAVGALVYICTWKSEKGIDDYLAAKQDPAKELSGIRGGAKSITSFIVPEHGDDVMYALGKAFDTMADFTKRSIMGNVSKALKIPAGYLLKTLSKEDVEKRLDSTDEEKEAALRFLKSPMLIEDFLAVCHTRYVGRDETLLLVKLATMTRHLPRGLSVILLGTSSVGKSALLETVLMTCDPKGVENFSRTSAQYLLYRKGPLNHKIITFYELNGTSSSSAIIRTALTEGVLHLGTVQKDASGSLCAIEIKKETQGLVILSTYTGSRIDPELATRVLVQEITHDKDLAREVYRRKAKRTENNADLFRIWKIADILIEAAPVHIPYLGKLAELFPTNQERFQRDFNKTVMLIEASALLHQYQREKAEDGAVVANEDDYLLVHRLSRAFAESLLPVTERVVKILEIAQTMIDPKKSELRDRLGIPKSTMDTYIRQAKAAELIETEGRGQNLVIRVIDVPQGFTLLPDPNDVFAKTAGLISEIVHPKENKGETVDDPSTNRDEPVEPTYNGNDSNGSDGPEGTEPEENLCGSDSTSHGPMAQDNDDVFVPEDECGDFLDLAIQEV